MSTDRHPTDEALWECARTGDAGEAGEHAAHCRRCAEELRFAGLVVASCGERAAACLDDVDLVLLAEGMLRDPEAVRHVEGCADCARHVEAAREAGSPVPSQGLAKRVVETFATAPRALPAALALLASAEMPAAIRLATRGSSAAPASPEIDLGMHAYQRRRFDEAAARFEAASRAGSESADTALLLGASLRRIGRPADAAAALRRAVALRPRVSEARWHLAQALLECGEGDAALAELDHLARKAGPRREAAGSQARSVRSAMNGR